MAACTSGDEVIDNGPVAARINAEISDAVATRASSTTWDDNGRIGLTSIGTQYDNVPYIMNGGEGKPIYFYTTEDVVGFGVPRQHLHGGYRTGAAEPAEQCGQVYKPGQHHLRIQAAGR